MMNPSRFTYSRRVIYADCTVGDHVYYGNFVSMLEEARGAFLRASGHPFLELQNNDFIFPVVECKLRYKAPAKYDDVLKIEIWITLAEGVRLNFSYRIENQANTLILEAETLHVCTGQDGKPKRLPEILRTLPLGNG